MTEKPESWLQRVRYAAAEPVSWLHHATTLRQAAEDLWIAGNAHEDHPGSELGSKALGSWKSPDFTPIPTGGSTREVCFMLFGFALENLAKGIIVCRDPSVVSKGKLKNWHGGGHNLVTLFKNADIALTAEERMLLDRTSRTTEWRGRYPVAMNFDKVDPQDRIIGHTVASNIWPAEEFAGLSALYERGKSALIAAMEANPPLPADYKFE